MAEDWHIATDPMIDDAARAGAIFVFSLSGGKDCGAASALAMQHLDQLGHPRELRYAMHADLGRAEWPITPAQVEAQADALGLPLKVVSASAGDLPARFLDRWDRGKSAYADLLLYNLRGPWSSPSLKFCQSEKKIQVMGPALAKAHRGSTIVQVTGLRRDESPARASTPNAKPDHRFAAPGNRHGTVMLQWNPAADMTREQVFAANLAHGIPLSPVYALGCSRHSCSACIMASQGDLETAGKQKQNAPLFSFYIRLEIESTFSFQAGGWLADKAPHLLSYDMAVQLGISKRLATRRREIEAALPARHRFVKGWPLFVPDVFEATAIADGRAIILDHHGLTNNYPSYRHIIDRFAFLVDAGKKRKAA